MHGNTTGLIRSTALWTLMKSFIFMIQFRKGWRIPVHNHFYNTYELDEI